MSEMKMLDEFYPWRNISDISAQWKYPYVGATVKVDITGFLAKVRDAELPFFSASCILPPQPPTPCLNLRRILDGGIATKAVPSSHTVRCLTNIPLLHLKYDPPFPDFIPYAQKAQEKAKRRMSTTDRAAAADICFTVPRLAYEP